LGVKGIEGYFKNTNCFVFLKTQALEEEMRRVLLVCQMMEEKDYLHPLHVKLRHVA
jgi:hypothetical protein